MPERVSAAWGIAYAVWAYFKVFDGLIPKMQCGGPPPVSILSSQVAMFEVVVGVATAIPASRRLAALAGAALNIGFVPFAFVADARQLPWEQCGCFFAGIHMPWLPWHAIAGGVLALPFFAIFLDAERKHARTLAQRAG